MADAPAAPAAPAGSPSESLLLFGRFLAANGMAVSQARMLAALAVAGRLGLSQPEDLAHGLRAALARGPEEFRRFDPLFAEYFWGAAPGPKKPEEPGPGRQPGEVEPEKGREKGERQEFSPASAQEVLGGRGFAAPPPQDLAGELMRILAPLLKRLSRRKRPRGGQFPLLSATLRKSLRNQGELVDLAFARRRVKERRLVVLADVSGSMEMSTPFLPQFWQALAGAGRQAEIFAFATRLTRLTPFLRPGGPLAGRGQLEITRRIPDLAGGTLLGPCLGRLISGHGGLLGQNSILLVVSDGWDRGDPVYLARQMEKASRRVKRVVWLNPLLSSPNYRPVNRGMAAALPFVDYFLPCHDLAAFARVAGVLFSLLK